MEVVLRGWGEGRGEEVTLTTGRNVAQAKPGTLPGTFTVLLDDGTGLAALLMQRGPGHVTWSASLDTPAEKLAAGPLAEVGEEILRTRAGIKVAWGWVMDVWVGKRSIRSFRRFTHRN